MSSPDYESRCQSEKNVDMVFQHEHIKLSCEASKQTPAMPSYHSIWWAQTARRRRKKEEKKKKKEEALLSLSLSSGLGCSILQRRIPPRILCYCSLITFRATLVLASQILRALHLYFPSLEDSSLGFRDRSQVWVLRGHSFINRGMVR